MERNHIKPDQWHKINRQSLAPPPPLPATHPPPYHHNNLQTPYRPPPPPPIHAPHSPPYHHHPQAPYGPPPRPPPPLHAAHSLPCHHHHPQAPSGPPTPKPHNIPRHNPSRGNSQGPAHVSITLNPSDVRDREYSPLRHENCRRWDHGENAGYMHYDEPANCHSCSSGPAYNARRNYDHDYELQKHEPPPPYSEHTYDIPHYPSDLHRRSQRDSEQAPSQQPYRDKRWNDNSQNEPFQEPSQAFQNSVVQRGFKGNLKMKEKQSQNVGKESKLQNVENTPYLIHSHGMHSEEKKKYVKSAPPRGRGVRWKQQELQSHGQKGTSSPNSPNSSPFIPIQDQKEESDDDGDDNNSVISESRTRRRGFRRERNRSRGKRQRSQSSSFNIYQKSKSKFTSVPDLVSENAHRGPESQTSKVHVPKEKKVNSKLVNSSADTSSDQGVGQVTVALQVYMTFNETQHLKDEILKHFEMKNNIKPEFQENSLICQQALSLCNFKLDTTDDEFAKGLVKLLKRNMEEALGVKVTYDLYPCGRNKKSVSGDMNQPKTPLLHTPKPSKKKKEKGENTEQTFSERNRDSTASQVQNKIKSKEARGGIPLPVPTKISVSIEKSFSSSGEVESLLGEILRKMQGAFKVLTSSIAITNKKTICELETNSKADAKRITKLLNITKDVQIFSTSVGNGSANPVDDKEKQEALLQNKVVALAQIKEKRNQFLEKHMVIINKYEQALSEFEKSRQRAVEMDKRKNCISGQRGDDNINDEDEFSDEKSDSDLDPQDEAEMIALRDKLTESVKQKAEFEKQCQHIIDEVEKLLSKNSSEKELTNLEQRVGIECMRLANALPIYAKREEIVNKVSLNQVSIILGETGSGKSTQIVQYLYNAGLASQCQIVCTQPRKVAAVTLAERVAKEMAGVVGNLVGYKTGAKMKMNDKTKIVFTTDHSLLNECLKDPMLRKYSCIIVDEAHERSIYTDILLGMIKACIKKRPELKVIITSATIDPHVFIEFFNCEHELRVSGQTFPVDVHYDDSNDAQDFENYEKKAVAKAVSLHKTEEPGDILVFLTSSVEIARCCDEIQKLLSGQNNFRCFPLHGQLPPEEQRKVFEPLEKGIRKIVFSTNCAETSLTIDGIKYVVDTGVAKEMRFDSKKNLNLLDIQVISKSSADQRKGRAGRTSSGKCFRLYSEDQYKKMTAITEPEILRVHLGQAVLKLAELGVNLQSFDFVQPPSADAVEAALFTLLEVGALSSNGEVTDIGRWISKLPFDPRQGTLVYHGNSVGLLYDALVLAALISNGSNFFYKGLSEAEVQKSALSKNEFGSAYGDIFSWFTVFKYWSDLPAKQRSAWCREKSINYKSLSFTKQCIIDVDTVLKREMGITMQQTFSKTETSIHVLRKLIFKANMSSLSHFLGHTKAGYNVLALQRQVHFHPSSTMMTLNTHPDWIVYTELTKTSREFIRGITVVEEEWLKEEVASGKLKIDIAQAKQQRIELVHHEEVGSLVFKALVGPRFSSLRNLENELAYAGMTNAVVEANRDLGTLDIYATSKINAEAIQNLNSIKEKVVNTLKQDELEKDIGQQGSSGLRVILGQGGEVQNVFMPNQSNKVLIRKTTGSTTVEEIFEKFSKFGTIQECKRFHKDDPWGFVRYGTFTEAHLAVEETADNEACQAILKIDNKAQRMGNGLEAKLSWCRRPCKGIAFIKVPPIEKASLIFKHLHLNGSLCQIQVSRQEEDLICYKVGNANEAQIKEQILELLEHKVNDNLAKNVKVTICREKRPVPSRECLGEMEDKLVSSIEKFVPKEQFGVYVKPPKEHTIDQVAFVRFDSLIKGFEACKQLADSIYIDGAVVNINPSLKTVIHVPKHIKNACNSRFEEIIQGLMTFRDTQVNLRPTKQGHFCFDIRSSIPESIIEARDLILRELDGEVIPCSNSSLKKFLLKRDVVENFKRKLESCLMIVDVRKEELHIYGSETDVNKAKVEINAYLNHLSNGSHETINLRDGMPPCLVKTMVENYGISMNKFVSEFGLDQVSMDWKLQHIQLFGSAESVRKAKDSILGLSMSLQILRRPSKMQEMPDCAACFCPVENSESLYRLEGCGHSYCTECIKTQIISHVHDKMFPLSCVEQTCGKPFVLKDIRFCLAKKWLQESQLLNMSINSFTSQSKNGYKYCITPNCPAIYKVTEKPEGCEFICPMCFVSLCSSCNSPFHLGLTCAMVVSSQLLDVQFREWQQKDPEKRKNCPVCGAHIEKSEGCNKMECFSCKCVFCWVCLESFEGPDSFSREQKCYAHLQSKHAGLF